MDISNAGEPVILPAAKILPEARAPLPEAVGPSNRVNAVGQLARTAVQDARESGIDLPKNAQGHAASRIARGADPESVFSALVADAAPPEDGAEGAEEAADAPDGDAVAAAGDDRPTEEAGSAEVIELVPDDPVPEPSAGLSPGEAALDLLSEDQVA